MITQTPLPIVRLVCVAAALMAVACDTADPIEPIVGAWESTERIGSDHNEMQIDADLDGEATIYFFFDGEWFFADFDVTAEPEGGGDYALEFDCDGGCSELDFTAECELDRGDLLCKADGLWEDYEFEWEVR
ncbi:MAG: hypothetical protein K0V04_10235 [Deltaproteobacteria bacterium]|nr:hypothetical protein [Deltaproteobacteria bacterium]